MNELYGKGVLRWWYVVWPVVAMTGDRERQADAGRSQYWTKKCWIVEQGYNKRLIINNINIIYVIYKCTNNYIEIYTHTHCCSAPNETQEGLMDHITSLGSILLCGCVLQQKRLFPDEQRMKVFLLTLLFCVCIHIYLLYWWSVNSRLKVWNKEDFCMYHIVSFIAV